SGETFPLFTNEGDGMFRDATHQTGLATLTLGRSGWGVATADLDNDGWKDIATANSHVNDEVDRFEASRYREPNAIFRNVGGRFEDVSAQAGEGFTDVVAAHRGLVAVDLDNDGRLELVTTRLGEGAIVWRNVSAPQKWLRVRLVGRASNRDAIGAVIRAHDVTNVMTSAVGYASAVVAPVHLGLGDAGQVDVEITW